MTKLGDCKCLPKDDMEGLIQTADVAKEYLKKTFPTTSEHLMEEISEFQDRVKNTMVCSNDGEIKTKCTCLSNFEKRMIMGITRMTLRSESEFGHPSIEDVHGYYKIAERLKDITKTCPEEYI